MNTKVCRECGERKNVEHFHYRKRNVGWRHHLCNDCKAIDDKQRYAAASESKRAKNNEHRENRKAINRPKILAYLLEHPCVDCGEEDPVVLEFDHRDPSTKKRAIASMIFSCNWPQIELEIAKCDVRCANCHRRKTSQGTWKVMNYNG